MEGTSSDHSSDMDAVPELPGEDRYSDDVRPVVAAFDFDGTLTVRSQLERFVLEAGGYRRTVRSLLTSLLQIVQIPRSSAHRDAAKGKVLRKVFAGRDANAVHALGRSFALHILRSRMRDDTLARLRWHQSQGHSTVIVSASLTEYLDPIGTALGVDGVIATALEVREGKLTGELQGDNVRGAEKVRRLDTWIRAQFGTTDVELWAYGDTSGDTALLNRSDHPEWVKKRTITPTPTQG